LIPGGRDSGWRWCYVLGGRLQGSDCFSCSFSKVLREKKQGYVVIFNISESCKKNFVTARY
jgi:hypothetical protein